MQIVCPNCSARYNLDDSKITDKGVRLRCSRCKEVFSVSRDMAAAPVQSAPTPVVPGPRFKVVVANESPAFCAAVIKVLEVGPFEVTACNDGKEAMSAIEIGVPDVVLLDVALPSMYGFEICEAVRRNPALDRVKLILVASIYDKTKYKRTPASLYGADAYIEKHHIPDSLNNLALSLVGSDKQGGLSGLGSPEKGEPGVPVTRKPDMKELAEAETTRQTLKRDEEISTGVSGVEASGKSAESFADACDKARRLARIIVSDILLYNQAKVMEGIRNGSLYELLSGEIKEGRALYMRRVSPEVAAKTSFLDEAFDQLIASKRQEMNF